MAFKDAVSLFLFLSLACQAAQPRIDELAALKLLHAQIDANHDGVIDERETVLVINGLPNDSEMQLDMVEDAHEYFHLDAERDQNEVFAAWNFNPARNWTTTQMARWAANTVKSEQLKKAILRHMLTGLDLPQLAVNDTLSRNLISSPMERARLRLRSMDVVLFGPQRLPFWQEYALVLLGGVVSISILAILYHRQKAGRTAKELQLLLTQSSELQGLNAELKTAEQQLKSTSKAHEVQRDILREQVATLQASGTLEELKAEVNQLRQQNTALQQQASQEVKELLEATYAKETALFEHKKASANAMRQDAERDYQKILSKKKGMLGSLRLAHSDTPFQVEAAMAAAKHALNSVIADAQERQRRWNRLQDLFDLDLKVVRPTPFGSSRSTASTSSNGASSRKKSLGKLRRRQREAEQDMMD